MFKLFVEDLVLHKTFDCRIIIDSMSSACWR